MEDPLKGKYFVHFKGGVYKVISSLILNEFGEGIVLYERVHPVIVDGINQFVQPIPRFLEVVYRDDEKYLRFTEVTEDEVQAIINKGEYPCLIYKPDEKE